MPEETATGNVIQSVSCQFHYLHYRKNIVFTGDVPGMLDYMIWPWFERIDAFKIVAPDRFVVPTDRYKKLVN
jgi:hypothetical protein